MNTSAPEFIWIFHGEKAQFASGTFLELETALLWISENRLTGILTKYPVNTGVYDWAIQLGYFKPKREDQTTPEFIGKFTCANMAHCHIEDGKVEAGP